MARRNCTTRDSERCGYADTRQKARAFRRKPVEIAIEEGHPYVKLGITEYSGHRLRGPQLGLPVGASLGTAVLNRIAAATSSTMLSASAPPAQALVHGCASAAGLAVLVVLAGAAGRDLDSHPTDSLLAGVHP